MNPRIAAYETLFLCEKEKQFSNIAISNGIKRYGLDGIDRDFYTRLVYGVIEKELTLNYLIQQYTEKSIKRLDKPVAIILRLSLYQILYLDKVPNSAAVSEGVKLASRFASRAKGYINAILRKACLVDPAFPNPRDRVQYLSVYYSVSPDICQLLMDQYGERAESILQGYQTNPNVCLQINAKRHTRDTFLEKYPIQARKVDDLPFAIQVTEKLSLSAMPFLENGDAFVQDVASQLSACVLSPEANSTVIDVCACPGGKSFSAANLMYSQIQTSLSGKIYSFDLHESKLPLIQKGSAVLDFPIIRADVQDAVEGRPELIGKADRVICDVPCSGLGVIAKKPEIRYKDIREIYALPQLQYQILCRSVQYLKENGVLVYSTCTINKKENEEVYERFLAEHPGYKAIDFSVGSFQSHNGYLTLFPSKDHDGFFIAKIKKK